jgi:hypothetical protein
MKYNSDSGAPTCQIQVAVNKYQVAISSQWDQHEQLGDQARDKPSHSSDFWISCACIFCDPSTIQGHCYLAQECYVCMV